MMSTRTVTVVGGNLFAIAATELGDATAWDQIASLNGLSDPFITGLTTLLLPEASPSLANSVLS